VARTRGLAGRSLIFDLRSAIGRSAELQTMIKSRQHDLVKTFRRVARGSDAARVLIDGWHLLEEGVSARMVITDVAVGSGLEPPHTALVARLERSGARVSRVSAAVMDALSPVRSPTGVVALAERPAERWEALLCPAPALVLVAAGVQDPGNAGATIRAAEAGGATGVVLAGEAADAWGWKALRAAMGSTFRLPVARRNDAAEALRTLKAAGLRIVAAEPRRGVPMSTADLRRPIALVLGAEGPGVDASVRDLADEYVTIPMRPPVESLNVAVAAALLVYEASRQRSP
jgi:TrmH family RNA methyltransferase